MSLSSFVLFIVVYLVGFWKLLRPFSSAACSICFRVRCINVVMNTHTFKVYECCVKLLRHTLRLSQGLACERMYIFSLCRRPGNKLYNMPELMELHYRRIIIVQKSMLLGPPTRPSIMETHHSFLYINTIL